MTRAPAEFGIDLMSGEFVGKPVTFTSTGRIGSGS
jgi:hypothetical protein